MTLIDQINTDEKKKSVFPLFPVYQLEYILYTIIPNVVRMPENQSSNPIRIFPPNFAELITASIKTHHPIASYFIY